MSAAQTRIDSGSSAPIARGCSIRLRTCTSPMTGNGKSDAVMSCIWSGNASMCG
jgi:hypothetical protein